MRYDPSILRLYCRYLTAYAFVYTTALALVGALAGAMAASFLNYANVALWGAAGGFLLAILGYLKSYRNKVEAHEMLCNVETEDHLRRLADRLAPQEQQTDQREQP